MRVSLADNLGKVTIIHFTQLENPLCIECEAYMHQQIEEIEGIAASGNSDVEVITVNIRKNPYSEDGWSLVEEWYGTNITWHWIEEFDPFPVSSSYLQYWEVNGAFSNPTIVLVDEDLVVVGVYNVYCIGKGVVDGVQSANSLQEDAAAIMSGEWTYTSGDSSGTAVSVGGMFLLGVITSFSPCSLALLMAVISFIGAAAIGSDKQEVSSARRQSIGLKIGIAFTIGTSLVFLMFGLAISSVGRLVDMSSTFYLIAGIILVILGINIVLPIGDVLRKGLSAIRQEPSCPAQPTGAENSVQGRLASLSRRSPELAGFLLGILFSLGWAPCALSLVFPVLILLISQDISILMGGVLMFTFGLGHGAIIIPFCAATGEIKGALGNKYVSLSRWIQIIFAVAIVAVGMIFAARYFGFSLW
ncbi:MAG: cytochrome c biogenesis protein CcdA [Methanobacteriota archaeon]|nr:MAG: cytochrome c biogenesis protein CcdA [Euryarchaeota archaeon]